MRFGLSLPPFGDFADISYLADLASEAETLGWEGFFIWDHILHRPAFHPIADPWVALGVIAQRTTTMRIGTMVTPLARRRPWVLARQTVSVDRLSNGRLTLGVGLGSPAQWEYGVFGEPTDLKIMAQRLDEGLNVLDGLWTGQPFRYDGQHYHIDEVTFVPAPIQQPRIPIWVGGFWPNKPPMRRAARWDGCFILHRETTLSPDDWRDVLSYIRQHRTLDTPFEVVHGERLSTDLEHPTAATLEAYAEAGVTWWIEELSPWRFGANRQEAWQPVDTQRMVEWIRRGPPQM